MKDVFNFVTWDSGFGIFQKAFDHAVRFLPSDAVDCVRNVVNRTTVSGVSLKGGKGVRTGVSKDQAHERFLAVRSIGRT